MEDLWERAEEILADGKPFVLATIIRTRGSVPREVGAKMVVPPDGQPFGTIGGGCGEGEVLRRAYPLLDEPAASEPSPPRIVQVDLTGDFDQDEIQVCGGVMDVALDRWQPAAHRGLVHTLAEAARAQRPAALVTALDQINGVRPGTKSCLAVDGGAAGLTPAVPVSEETLEAFSESLSSGKPQLYAVAPPRRGAGRRGRAQGKLAARVRGRADGRADVADRGAPATLRSPCVRSVPNSGFIPWWWTIAGRSPTGNGFPTPLTCASAPLRKC